MSKMNPEVKALWIEALRSGEYEQGQATLRSDGIEGSYYCCLGVLCDLAEKRGIVEFREATTELETDANDETREITYDAGYAAVGSTDRYTRHNAYLPHAVYEWSGVDQSGEYVYSEDGICHVNSLVRHNDSDRMNFHQIAEVIEKYL